MNALTTLFSSKFSKYIVPRCLVQILSSAVAARDRTRSSAASRYGYLQYRVAASRYAYLQYRVATYQGMHTCSIDIVLSPSSSKTKSMSKEIPPSSPKPPSNPNEDEETLDAVLKLASDILFKQAILENFVHHNPWEHFQHLAFDDAQERIKILHSYVSPGERCEWVLENCDRSDESSAPTSTTSLLLDPSTTTALLVDHSTKTLGPPCGSSIVGGAAESEICGRVRRAVSELAGAFLDRGSAKWDGGLRKHGFLAFFAELENVGFAGWRKGARKTASRIRERVLLEGDEDQRQQSLASMGREVLAANLAAFGAPVPAIPASTVATRERDLDFHPTTMTLRAMLIDVRGWGGMFERHQNHPEEAPEHVPVRLLDFCVVLSILLR